ncbi:MULTISPECIES: protein phosphatase 2C domain-containing protein [unclassified Pseudoalteromonas]|uniref:PP2C family protein-serine/threonine phosphatase n=1 Tax=unclassified Pseudoalteromonas TaxID=194690 RepID=UPI0004242F63|nr:MULTISPECIES: protein phosphatase 2C domain-containing protein [unclassified Pseudoalteromonas]TMP53052.1 serine/threonine-protein phosphatase [Pseudoalteromonas sp. S1688]
MINNLSSSYAITHRGAVRQLNEDAHVEINSHNLWVVADGMGGHEAGEVASQLVVDVIRTQVEKFKLEDLNVSDIVKAIEDANKQLTEYSAQYLSNKTAGSTVTALFVKNERYYILWVGDSRAYLLRNSKLTQVSRDHSQVNDLIDEGMISVEEAKNHPLSNVITRAVGVMDEVKVDVVEGDINTGDIFLLCSDGLTGELSDEEICLSLEPSSIIDSGMALMHSSLVRGAKDNVTCILVKYDDVDANQSIQSCNLQDEATIPLFTK